MIIILIMMIIVPLMTIIIPLKGVQISYLTVQTVMLGWHNSWLTGSNGHAWPA